MQEVDSLLVQVGDAEGLVMGKALVAQGTDDALQATVARLGQAWVLDPLGYRRQRHGMGVLSAIDEPQHQVPLDNGIFQPEVVPGEQVHAAPFAALDIFPPQIGAEDVQVLKFYRLILNHMKRINLLFW